MTVEQCAAGAAILFPDETDETDARQWISDRISEYAAQQHTYERYALIAEHQRFMTQLS